jgi:acetolactate decarboxylase
MKKNIYLFLHICALLSLLISQGYSQQIHLVGAMWEVMHEGKLYGNIQLYTISNKSHLYGLGPVEGLKGEIMILDGKCYVAKYESDTSATMTQTYAVEAPFFGYTNIEKWKELSLPKSVISIADLDKYLNQQTKKSKRPFFFKMEGEIASANVHIMALPEGVQVTSPQVAHEKGQKHYALKAQKVILLGFFSTEHQTIFTHHSTFTHIHLLSADEKIMGHLDEIRYQKGKMKLYLPQK